MVQVRRAMETWARVDKAPRRQDYPSAARKLVDDLAVPAARRRDKAALAEALAVAARTRTFNAELIAEMLVRVMGDSSITGLRPEAVLLLFEARWSITTRRFHELTDEVFRWARAVYLSTRPKYQANHIRTVAEQTSTFETLVNDACVDLGVILGLALTRPPAAGWPEALSLELWKAGRVDLRATTSVRETGLLLPTGARDARLAIEVELRIKEP
jgi:hypothetical protein